MKKIPFHLKIILFISVNYLNGMVSPLLNKKKDNTGTFNLSFVTPTLNLNNSPTLQLPQNFPYLGEYGEPYKFLTPIVIIQNNPEMLASNVVPQELSKEFVTQFKSNDLKKIINENKIEFYTLLWSRPVEFIGKPTDEVRNIIYNVVFHSVMQNWYSKERDFAQDILTGIFQPNGVEPKGGNPISFNKLTAQNVNIHDGTQALSPNNAQFGISANRNLVTFWFLGISSETKKAVITFNIFAIDENVENYLGQAAKSSKNLADLLTAINLMQHSIKLNNEDQNTTQLIVNIINRLLESIKPLEIDPTLKKIFPDDKFNSSLFPFPIKLLASKNDLFQFEVLPQNDLTGCLKIPGITGATCGRHSFKNAIFALLAMHAYQTQNQAAFEKFANHLIKLTPESICIFKQVNQIIEEFRKTKGRNISEETLLSDEVEEVINKMTTITDKCQKETGVNLVGITSDLFTTINYDFLESLERGPEFFTSAQFYILEKITNLIETFKKLPDVQHAFLLGLPGHWIVVTVNKINNKTNYIILDSLNSDRTNNKYVELLIKLLNNPPDFKILKTKSLIQETDNLSKNLKETFGQLSKGEIRGPTWQGLKKLQELSIADRNYIAKKFVENLSDALIKSIELENQVATLSEPERKKVNLTTINDIKNLAQDFQKIIQNYPILKDLENPQDIQDVFRNFIASKRKNVFEIGLKKLQINVKIPDELKKPLLKYQSEFPNIFTNPNEINKDGQTPIMKTVLNNDLDALKALIVLGADVNVPDTNKTSALMYASHFGNKDIFEYLLNNKANLNAVNNNKQTAISIARQNNQTKIIELIISKLLTSYLTEIPGLLKDINAQLPDKRTGIYLATVKGDIKAVEVFIQLGANVNSKDANGTTPLMMASYLNFPQIVKLLKDSAADINAKNNAGKSALDYARDNNNLEIIKILQSK